MSQTLLCIHPCWLSSWLNSAGSTRQHCTYSLHGWEGNRRWNCVFGQTWLQCSTDVLLNTKLKASYGQVASTAQYRGTRWVGITEKIMLCLSEHNKQKWTRKQIKAAKSTALPGRGKSTNSPNVTNTSANKHPKRGQCGIQTDSLSWVLRALCALCVSPNKDSKTLGLGKQRKKKNFLHKHL